MTPPRGLGGAQASVVEVVQAHAVCDDFTAAIEKPSAITGRQVHGVKLVRAQYQLMAIHRAANKAGSEEHGLGGAAGGCQRPSRSHFSTRPDMVSPAAFARFLSASMAPGGRRRDTTSRLTPLGSRFLPMPGVYGQIAAIQIPLASKNKRNTDIPMSNATAFPAGTRVSAPMGWNAQGAENPRALGTLHTDMEAGDRWAHVRWDEADLPAFVPAYSLAAIR